VDKPNKKQWTVKNVGLSSFQLTTSEIKICKKRFFTNVKNMKNGQNKTAIKDPLLPSPPLFPLWYRRLYP
jgi:hypothetical protein